MKYSLIALTFCFAFTLYGEEEKSEAQESVAPSSEQAEPVPSTSGPSVEVPQKMEEELKDAAKVETKVETNSPGRNPKRDLWIGKLISLGARIDANYTGGGAIAQGFAIPSLRVSAYGEAGEAIDYRISLAQTREYSSALLPQMLPSEAYVDLSTNPVRNGERAAGMDVRLRIGMCAPLINPWWTPDLAELALPDYHEIHKANFVSRDIGTEIAIRPFGENLTIAAGAFNGSGITTLNTNNSKAFSGHVHLVIPMSSLKLGLGNGSYYSEQSTPGAINYKKNWFSDFFAYLSFERSQTSIQFDTFISEYEDPSRALSPNGYAVSGTLGLTDWMGAFARYEYSSTSPQRGSIRSLQVGPSLLLSDYARAFAVFQALQIAGSEERSIFLRVRVSI